MHAALASTSPSSLVQLEGTAESLQATATFQQPIDLASTRFALVGDSSVLDLSHATFDARPDGSLAIAVNTRSSLAAGDFIGKYRLGLCADSACSQVAEAVSGQLAYSLTVVPKVTISLTGGRCNSFCSYWLVATGSHVVATSNVPVAWDWQSNAGAPVQFQVVSSTPTRWEALLAGTHSTSVNSTATLTATALQQPTYRPNAAAWTFFAMPPGFY